MKKLLTSSYNSSTPSLCTSESASAGCLTAIFHRILCSRGLPTHPSDQIRELDYSISNMSGKVQEFKTDQDTTESTTTTITPGIVERLMGLESMGVTRETSIEATSSSSLPRSKSMNSVDYLGECKKEDLHKRAKSSSSFREVPTFHLHENENFLVLSFESGCGGGEFRSKERKKQKGYSKERGEFKKNKREKVHHDDEKKGNLSDMSSSSSANVACSEKECVDSEMVGKEVTNGGKVKRRKKEKTCYAEKKVDTECSSEDSSPVSIFDFERGAPATVAKVDSFGFDTSWRRKLSPELENDHLEDLHCDSNLMIEEMKVNTIENNKHEGSKNNEWVDIWGGICRLVEDDLGSTKLDEGLRKPGDFESVCADFESEILDKLLHEFIDQLVGNPLKALELQNL